MIGVGIVGAGMVADIHIKALRSLADIASIVGVHARRPEQLEAFCAERQLRPFAELDALINAPEVDIVLVLTPPNARRDIVARCAAAGKAVLLEKPVERTSAAAADIVDRAERAGIALGVVFQHRFRAASLELARLVREGSLGALAAAQVMVPWWRPQSYYDVEGRGTYARDGGGVLISQAIHTLDLMGVFTGPVARVQAMAATTRQHRMEAEDFVAGGLEFVSGAVGSVVATTAGFPGGAESIVLDFEHAAARLQSGVLTVSHHDGRVDTLGEPVGTGGGADPMAFPYDWHAAALRDFIEAVRDGRRPAVTGRDALVVHRLIDALVQSARSGRAVAVEQNEG